MLILEMFFMSFMKAFLMMFFVSPLVIWSLSMFFKYNFMLIKLIMIFFMHFLKLFFSFFWKLLCIFFVWIKDFFKDMVLYIEIESFFIKIKTFFIKVFFMLMFIMVTLLMNAFMGPPVQAMSLPVKTIVGSKGGIDLGIEEARRSGADSVLVRIAEGHYQIIGIDGNVLETIIIPEHISNNDSVSVISISSEEEEDMNMDSVSVVGIESDSNSELDFNSDNNSVVSSSIESPDSPTLYSVPMSFVEMLRHNNLLPPNGVLAYDTLSPSSLSSNSSVFSFSSFSTSSTSSSSSSIYYVPMTWEEMMRHYHSFISGALSPSSSGSSGFMRPVDTSFEQVQAELSRLNSLNFSFSSPFYTGPTLDQSLSHESLSFNSSSTSLVPMSTSEMLSLL